MAAVELATAYVALVPSAKGISAGISKELGAPLERAARDSGAKATDAFGSQVTSGMRGVAIKAAGVFAAGFAALKVGSLVKDTIGEASDLNESISKVGAVFKDTQGDVLAWGQTAATALGLSKQQALEAASTFGNFLISMGNTEGPAEEMSKNLVNLGADLASFNNVDIGEVLLALRSGLAGEAEPLRRFGVNLSASRIQAEGLTKGIRKTFNEMTGAEKSTLAYSIILKDTALAQGDFARTSGGLANQQRIFSANIKDLKAKLGDLFLPAAIRTTQFLNDRMIPVFQSIIDGVGPTVVAVLGFQEALGTAVLPILAEVIGGVQAMVTAFIDGGDDITSSGLAGTFEAIGVAARNGLDVAIGKVRDLSAFLAENRDIVVPLTASLASLVGTLLAFQQVSKGVGAAQTALAAFGPAVSSALGPLLANPAGLLIAGIVAVGVAFFVAYQNVQPFREAVDNAVSVVRGVALQAFNRLASAAHTAAAAFANVGDTLSSAFSTASDAARTGLRAVSRALAPLVRFVNENLVSTFAAIGGFFGALFDRVSNLIELGLIPLKQELSFLGSVVSAAFGPAAALVSSAFDQIVNAIRGFVAVGAPILQTAFDGVRITVETVFGAITAVVETALGVIRGIFQVGEGILRGDFGKIWEGLQTLVEAPLQAANDFVSRTFDNMVGFVLDMPGRLETAAFGMWDAILGAFKNMLNGIINAWNSLKIPSFEIGGWSTPFGDLPSWSSPEISFPQIPTLALGGLAMRPTLALVGDSVGPEAIIPLSRMPEMLAAALRSQPFAAPAPAPTSDHRRPLHIENLSVGSRQDLPDVRAYLKRWSLASRF